MRDGLNRASWVDACSSFVILQRDLRTFGTPFKLGALDVATNIFWRRCVVQVKPTKDLFPIRPCPHCGGMAEILSLEEAQDLETSPVAGHVCAEARRRPLE